MDVDDVSPSSGDGPSTRGHDNETDASLTARLIQMTFPEESVSFHSVTERWRERTAQTKGLGRVMQRWCQGENQTIQDLEGLAPFVFRHKCVHTLEKTCSSPLCQAVTDVIERSEIFLNYKDRYATAVAEHMEAVTTHMNYVDELNREKNQWKQKCSGDRNGTTLALWRKLVADAASGVRMATRMVVEVGNGFCLAADLVSCAAMRVTAITKNIFDCHEKVKIALEALRTAGNETSLITPVIRQAAAREKISSERRCDIETQSNPKLVATGDGLSLTTTESQPVTSETRSDLESEPCMPALDTLCCPCDLELDDVDFLPPLSTGQIESLSMFYTHLKCILGNATILVSNDAQYSLKIERTVNAILGWNVGDNSSTESSAIEFFSPGCVAQELVGVQPILYALMFKMIHVLGLEQHVMQEQRIQMVGIRASPAVDFVVSALQEENSAETSTAGLGLPIEAKPVALSNSKVCKLLLDAQNQVVGHLAKKAMFFFDMGGIGEDCTFVGLALSMSSIVVLVVELSGVGTESVMITTKRTKQAPLFDEATRKHLFVEKATEVEALFKDALEGQDMPTGFGLLARTLMSVQCGLGTSMMTRSDGFGDTFLG
ncbi:hypothetical protein MHU86_19120 [Fragilaria crotonensis]|nr:hypothetical protein MHU86_19120 [Fragilaria crotonensis]